MKIAVFSLMLIVAATQASAQEAYDPPNGFVPDAATAVAIARAILIPILGAKEVKAEEPLTASREGNVWEVQGTIPCPPEGRCDNMGAYVKLSVADGQVLFVAKPHYGRQSN